MVTAVLSLVAALAPWASGLPPIARSGCSLLAVALGAAALTRLLRPPFEQLRLEGHRLRLRFGDGSRREGRLTGSVFVSPLYVGFRWRAPGKLLPGSVGIFREQMNEQDYRRLCAALRQGTAP